MKYSFDDYHDVMFSAGFVHQRRSIIVVWLPTRRHASETTPRCRRVLCKTHTSWWLDKKFTHITICCISTTATARDAIKNLPFIWYAVACEDREKMLRIYHSNQMQYLILVHRFIYVPFVVNFGDNVYMYLLVFVFVKLTIYYRTSKWGPCNEHLWIRFWWCASISFHVHSQVVKQSCFNN